MPDIVDMLKEIRPFNYSKTDEELQTIAEKAAETIEKLRAALRKIGYDYVEFSNEKVQMLYLEHIGIARNAYQDSFPEQQPVDYKTVDDNF